MAENGLVLVYEPADFGTYIEYIASSVGLSAQTGETQLAGETAPAPALNATVGQAGATATTGRATLDATSEE
jgi:hypothetical protein